MEENKSEGTMVLLHGTISSLHQDSSWCRVGQPTSLYINWLRSFRASGVAVKLVGKKGKVNNESDAWRRGEKFGLFARWSSELVTHERLPSFMTEPHEFNVQVISWDYLIKEPTFFSFCFQQSISLNFILLKMNDVKEVFRYELSLKEIFNLAQDL